MSLLASVNQRVYTRLYWIYFQLLVIFTYKNNMYKIILNNWKLYFKYSIFIIWYRFKFFSVDTLHFF